MNIEYTDEQKELIEKAVEWYRDPDADQVFQYTGIAGTGKSLVMHAIIERLGLDECEISAMTYTGAAALVMRRNGFRTARTVHSTIYSPTIDPKTGKVVFVLTGYPLGTRLVCIDEASMINSELKDDIEWTNSKILVCGDAENQLPPIHGKPAYLNKNDDIFRLTKIMRQAKDSAIINIASMVRRGDKPRKGIYNNGEVIVMSKKEFDDNLDSIVKNYNMIVCGYNRTRDNLNKDIRKFIYNYRSPLPHKGERLICRKNNWGIEVDGINLVNGLCGTALETVEINDFSSDKYNLTFKADFMDVPFEIQADYQYLIAPYPKRKEMLDLNTKLKVNTFEKFEYAYAITTHVAQGSQFNKGVYIEEYIPDISKKLNYTGVTRFTNKCIYVIPK